MDPVIIKIRVEISPDGATASVENGCETIKVDESKIITVKPELNVVFKCDRWGQQVNKKPPRSCHGCTVQCYMKGTYNGEPIEL